MISKFASKVAKHQLTPIQSDVPSDVARRQRRGLYKILLNRTVGMYAITN
jgi:hypothetical protein